MGLDGARTMVCPLSSSGKHMKATLIWTKGLNRGAYRSKPQIALSLRFEARVARIRASQDIEVRQT